MQGNEMGPEQNQEMNSGQGFAHDGTNYGNTHDQAPAEPKFRGCSTLPQDMKAKKPISKHPADPKQTPDNGQAPVNGHEPWAFAGQDDQNDGPGAHLADADRRHDMRSIQPDSPPKKDHKKSIMSDRHKKGPKPLMGNHFKKIPHKKSIMDGRHKPMPKSLMEDYFPKMPPMKPIMHS
ncbi:MAG: hypothetical protein WAW52_04190 [Methanothrix sp.]